MGPGRRRVENLVNMNHDTAFRNKRVLITGHTGFKGSWLSLWLHDLGAIVRGYALAPENRGNLYELLGLEHLIESELGDIRDLDRLMRTIDEFRPEFIFHLAAQTLVRCSYQEPKRTFETNIGGSVNVLEAVRRSPCVRSVVYVTSDKCYRNKEWVWGYRETDELGGRDPYSASKAAAEVVFSAYLDSFFNDRGGLGVASVRAGNVIGGGDRSPDRIVPDCIRSLEAERPIILRNPGATRPWQHVLEPLSGYIHLALALHDEPKRFSGSWNFGPTPDAAYTVRHLAGKVVAVWGSGRVQCHSEAGMPHEASLLNLDISKARALLGWGPRWDFNDTVQNTVTWYKLVYNGHDALTLSRRQIQQYEAVKSSVATAL